MGPPDSHRITRVPRYSGLRYASYSFVYESFTLYGTTFQTFPLAIFHAMSRPYNPAHALRHQRFGLFPGRSPLLRESLLFSLPTGTKMFQFPAFAFLNRGMTGLQPAGLSHSEICGSKGICTYPQLFAAYHVLHRLQEPRHPPYALHYLLTAVDYDVDGSACSHEEGIHHAIFILYFFLLGFARTVNIQ